MQRVKGRILVIARDAALRATLARWLTPAGYTLELAESAKQARNLIAKSDFLAAILAPYGVTGAEPELSEQVSEAARGIILVAERADNIGRLRESMPDADYYLTKPLDQKDLIDKIERIAVLAADQANRAPELREALYFEGLTIDAGGHVVDINGNELRLPYKQFALLEALARRPGVVLSRDQLRGAIAGTGIEPYDRSIDVLVVRLRRRIEPDPKAPRYIITVAGAGYKFAAKPMSTALPLPDQPSIAVLPFTNISGDTEQEYFADGVVDDIILGLSRIKWLFVISRNSSFVYKGRVIDIKQVGRELGVRYVLTGSIRRDRSRIRVSGQLVEATTGQQVWAERYDRSLGNLFELQDDVTLSVVGAIEPKLIRAEIDRIKRKRPDSLDAYELYLQARPLVFSSVAADCELAITLLDRALKLEPDYTAAHAAAAWCRGQRFVRNCVNSSDKSAALTHARAALTLGCDDATVLAMVGFIIGLLERDYETALGAIDRALAISNSCALAYGVAANVHGWLGHTKETKASAEKALRLSPFDPLSYLAHLGLAVVHFKHGRFVESVAAAKKASQANPRFHVPYLIGAVSLVNLNRPADATKMARRMLELQPDYSISSHLAAQVGGPELSIPLAESLRKVGVPE
jgi:TolB-like protein/DNA-binding response OmpR family regulator/Tfp pilus assembly protein PilF